MTGTFNFSLYSLWTAFFSHAHLCEPVGKNETFSCVHSRTGRQKWRVSHKHPRTGSWSMSIWKKYLRIARSCESDSKRSWIHWSIITLEPACAKKVLKPIVARSKPSTYTIAFAVHPSLVHVTVAILDRKFYCCFLSLLFLLFARCIQVVCCP